MAHVARIDENGVVQEVHVIDNSDLPNNGEFSLETEQAANDFQHSLGLMGTWKLTSRNDNFRGRYAGIGFIYKEKIDKFVPDLFNNTDMTQLSLSRINDVVTLTGLTDQSSLLDWGCGSGLLANGIQKYFSSGRIADYHGVDVQDKIVELAEDIFSVPGFRFSLVNDYSKTYNPSGESTVTIPAENNSVDVFYAYSVFPHIEKNKITDYLKRIKEVLKTDGKAVITILLQDNNINIETLNHYTTILSKKEFEYLIQEAGLVVDTVKYQTEIEKQSLYMLCKT